MGAPIYLQDTSGLAQGITQAGSALGGALGQRAKTETERKRLEEISGYIKEADFSTPEGQRKFLMGAIKKKMDPKDAALIIKQMKPSSIQSFIGQFKQPGAQPGGQPGLEPTPSAHPGVQPPPTAGAGVGDPNVIEGAPTPTSQHPATKGDPFGYIPDEALVYASASDDKPLADFGKTNLDYRDSLHKRFTADRTYHTSRSKKYMESIDSLRSDLRSKRSAIENLKFGIKQGNLEQFGQDWWADRLGKWGTGLVTPTGALVKTNVKEFMIGDLSRISGRPNMFIEQRILGMTPQIGQTDESNLAMLTSLEGQTELQEKKVQLTDEIAERFENELGYVPGNISRIVDQALQPYAIDIQNKEAYQMRTLQERSDGLEKLANKKVVQGTPLTKEMATFLYKKALEKEPDKEKAKIKAKKFAGKLGYTIHTAEEYERYKL